MIACGAEYPGKRRAAPSDNHEIGRLAIHSESNSGAVAFMPNQKLKYPNAHKHGVFAATAILPGEDQQEFEKLHSALVEEWMPAGATEEDAVLSIAKAVWRKRRVQRFLEVQLWLDPLDPSYRPSFRDYREVHGLEPSTEPEQITALRRSAETVSGELFKQELALDERLDAMIDRALKRLIQTKAMKQMLRQTGSEREHDQPRKIVAKRTSDK